MTHSLTRESIMGVPPTESSPPPTDGQGVALTPSPTRRGDTIDTSRTRHHLDGENVGARVEPHALAGGHGDEDGREDEGEHRGRALVAA